MPRTITFTAQGFQAVKDEISRLTEERKAVLIRLQTAREMGDLSENGAYKAARWELGGIDRELRRLNHLVRFGVVAEETRGSVVGFGSRITVEHQGKTMQFTLVDMNESNPQEQKLSLQSPIGKAVFGKTIGDKVTVRTPSGEIEYSIKQVE